MSSCNELDEKIMFVVAEKAQKSLQNVTIDPMDFSRRLAILPNLKDGTISIQTQGCVFSGTFGRFPQMRRSGIYRRDFQAGRRLCA